jgi:hypothetical protein
MKMMWISHKLDPIIKVARQTTETMRRLCPEAVEYFTWIERPCSKELASLALAFDGTD